MFRTLIKTVVRVIVLVVTYHTLARVVRHFYKFPMPEFLAGFIDNPIRRRLQPPDATAIRHGIAPGMTVLEVGPGSGTYTLGAARRVGRQGKIVAIDIEPKMVERVQNRARAEGVSNVEARVADVYHLPFEDGTFDAVFMIAVMGEIPDPVKALAELRRVLKPSGTLATSELFMDPDYPLSQTLVRWASSAGLELKQRIGNFFYYTLIFGK